MKLVFSIAVLLVSTSLFASSTESCRSEVGLIQAEKLVAFCNAEGVSDCSVDDRCSQLIVKSCLAAYGDGLEFFNCGQQTHKEMVVKHDAERICRTLKKNDEMAYFTCRVNLYNGNPIQ